MAEHANEIDASEIFKQEADQLSTVKDLEDALNRFGYSKDDRISRRELVLIYNQIKVEMEKEIFSMANSTAYSTAKEMRTRLNKLRAEFDNLQISGVQNTRTEQVDCFGKASTEILTDVKRRQAQSIQQLNETFIKERDTHELYREIETNKLEQTISLIPTPKVRYSKRMIELFKAEYNLNKLKEYDEAIKVRRMIDKLLPKEEKQFYDNFNQSIENKRLALQAAQEVDRQRLDEKIKTHDWNELRRRELESNVYACHDLLHTVCMY